MEDSLVETLGYGRVKNLLSDSAAYLEVKIAAQGILNELAEADPMDDPAWAIAREQAWKQEKHKYLSDTNMD